jgi:hypothetical protein
VSGAQPVEVSVVGQAVQVTSGEKGQEGGSLKATAERLTRSGPGGAILHLEGNATVCYVRNGKRAEVSGHTVTVNLVTGRVEVEMDSPQPTPPSSPPPTTKLPESSRNYSWHIGFTR